MDLPPAEKKQLLIDWNATTVPLPEETCVHLLFEAQVAKSPNAEAVVFEDVILTYAELNARANQLAHALIALGVRADSPVAVALDRSPEAIIALLAIFKAGGVYVPFDPDYPTVRLTFMLEDSGARLLITRETLRDRLPLKAEHTIYLDSGQESLATYSESNPDLPIAPESLAYIIYTSGSTGRPKGVAVEHLSIAQHCQTIQACFELATQDRVLQFASLSFDASLAQILPPLSAGAAIVLPLPGLNSPEILDACLRKQKVTVMHLTPSFFSIWSLSFQSNPPPSLRVINSGGDVLPPGLLKVRESWTRPGLRFVNTYGPTEATITATMYYIPDKLSGSLVPIGRPLPHRTVYVLDKEMQPTPIGVPGELHIGGACLARGYLNRPELTAEKFIPDPFSSIPGARLYKTGDLVRYRPDGNLEFLGRLDHQVKIRGYRIELGEIEAALVAHPDIHEAVVIARTEQNDDKRLLAYIVKAQNLEQIKKALTTKDIRAFLQATLPDYMLPSAFIFLAELPLTPNRKVDRKVLVEQEIAVTSNAVDTNDELEEILVVLWGKVLHQGNLSIHDNFFELGGHSLIAILLVSRLRDTLGIRIPVEWIFEFPTVFELAARIRIHTQSEESSIPIPENLILPETTIITPDLLSMITLSQAEIEQVASTVDGGMRNIQDIYPLAPLQEGIFFHHLSQDVGDVYLLYHLFRLDTFARCEAFISAFQSVIDRHDIMRTAIVWEKLSEPVQVVLRHAVLPVEIQHFDPSAGLVADQLFKAYNPRYTRLDLKKAPLLRIILAEDGDRWVLLLLSHHLIMDHRTLEVILEEIATLMEGKAERLLPPLPFRNFVFMARGGITTKLHESFFRDMLGDIEHPTTPFGLINVHGDGSTLVEAHRNLPTELALRLRLASRVLGATPAALFHLAWALVLSRFCDQTEVVFGTVFFGRMQGGEGIEHALGLFMNTLPFRITCDARPVANAVKDTQQRLRELMPHEHASLSLVQRCSLIPVSAPLFSSFLNYRHSSELGNIAYQKEGIELITIEEQSNYPLSLAVDDLSDGFSMTVQVDTPIEPERICAFMECAIEALVNALEKAPHTQLCELDILPSAEKKQLLIDWNATTFSLPNDTCVHLLFEEQVSKTPDAEAVVFEDVILTYAELNARANQLAHALIVLGVKSEEPVAVLLERSPEVIVALLAILKAGCVYVPFDPDYPAARLTFMLEDSGARILITRAVLLDRIPLKAEHTIYLDRDQEYIATHSKSNPYLPITFGSLAYIIYTSGSTGSPKGVAVEHRSIAQHCQTIPACFKLTTQDRFLQFASISFDASLEQILPTLSVGAAIVLPTPGLLSDEMLNECMLKQGVTVLELPPAFFQLWSLSCKGSLFPLLRLIILAGDVVVPKLLNIRESWIKPWPRILNVYGPTEATISTTLYDIPEGLTGLYVPIGQPLPHRTVYVLDKEMHLTPMGVPGELHIGGLCLARGYRNRKELTAEKFIPDPFSSRPGARIYKTGDLVRYRSDGNLEFLGRLDHQVKIRGFRIELGEIEEVLRSHSNVSEAVVIRWDDLPGLEKLVAYVVAKKPVMDMQKELRVFILKSLPDYMIPSAFVFLNKMPLTPNRKIDRKALPHPERTLEINNSYKPPEDEIEKQLVILWEEVIGVHPIGIHDDFFEIGGHSLIAVKLLSKIQKEIGTKITLPDIFQSLTIANLASRIKDESLHSSKFSSLVCIQSGSVNKVLPPLFFIHVLGIGLKYCRPIAKYLGQDRPIYGLSIQLLDKRPKIGNSVEDLAQFYISEVKHVYPAGPYLFAGFSFGSLVAFEMARQMRVRGEDVRLVALFDTILPAFFQKTDMKRMVKEHQEKFKKQGVSYLMQKAGNRLRTKWLLVKIKVVRSYWRTQLWYYNATGRTDKISIGLKEFAIWDENREIEKNYRPDPYPAKVVLFKSEETILNTQYLNDPQLGWGNVALGGVEIIECEGSHVGMVEYPHVEILAKKLNQSIIKALNTEMSN